MKTVSIFTRILLFAIAALSNTLHAQQEIQNSFYMFNSSVLNPAYAGSRDALSVVTDHRNQWTGWKGAPITTNLIAHTPLRRESIGVGINLVQDKLGPTTKTAFFADFAYRLKLNERNDRLCFGLRSGADIIRNQVNNLEMNDKTDPLHNNQISFNTNAFNAGGGIYYYTKRAFVGLTAPKIIPNKLTTDAVFAASKQATHYYLMAGYVWKLNALWDIKPGFCAKYTPNAPVSVDLNLSALFMEKIWFGIMYRKGAAAGANIMYQINKQMRVGYAYDYSITSMSYYSPSTHEVIFGYDLIPVHRSLKSPRYF